MLRKPIMILLIILFLYVVSFMFYVDNSLTGDGQNFIVNHTKALLENGNSIWVDEPLDDWVHQVLILKLGVSRGNLVLSYRLTSFFTGLMYIFFSYLVARQWFSRLYLCNIFFLHIILIPPIVQFYGTVESYGFLNAFIPAYIYFAGKALKQKSSPGIATVTCSLAVCFHLSGGWLFPSILYLYFNFLKGTSWNNKVKHVGIGLVLFMIPVGFTLIILWNNGIAPWLIPRYTHALGTLSVDTLPDGTMLVKKYYPFRDLTSFETWKNIGYTVGQMFSIPLLAAIMGLIMSNKIARKKMWFDTVNKFLGCIAGFGLLFIVIWKPLLGPVHDWTLFVYTSTGITMLGFRLLFYQVENSGHMKFLLKLISITFLIYQFIYISTWVLVNHQSMLLSRYLSINS